MPELTIDLHTHSDASDGELSPAELAEHLHSCGIGLAALTDHNTLEGGEAFRSRAERLGMSVVSGVEIDLPFEGCDVHILCYGFLNDLGGMERFLEMNRRNPPRNFREGSERFRKLRETVHGAGGLLFLAHPLAYPLNPETRGKLILDLKERGLDGIEAYYSPYLEEERQDLVREANIGDLKVCGGSDFHRLRERIRTLDFPGVLTVRRAPEPGIAVPRHHIAWLNGLVGR